MDAYPVFFSVARPERFDRAQLGLRLLFLVVLSFVGISLGVVFALLYLALPLIAAIMLSQRGPVRFLAEDGPRVARNLRWVTSGYAYLMLLTDRPPGSTEDDTVRFAVEPGAWSTPAGAGGPSVTTALLRLFYSLPSAIVLSILGMISSIVWLVSALMILLTTHYPDGLYDFQCGVLRWQARLLAYHASLVDAYPPFSFDTGPVAHIHDEPLTH